MMLAAIVTATLLSNSVQGAWCIGLPSLFKRNIFGDQKPSAPVAVYEDPYGVDAFYKLMGSPDKLKRSPGDSDTCKEEYIKCKGPECCSRMSCARIKPYPFVCLANDAKIPNREEYVCIKEARAECKIGEKCCGDAKCVQLGGDPWLCLTFEAQTKAQKEYYYGNLPQPGDDPNCKTRHRECQRSEDCCAKMVCSKYASICYPK